MTTNNKMIQTSSAENISQLTFLSYSAVVLLICQC